jgi:hypothetical protein
MSLATDVLTSGFTALLESNGEAVTFRGVSVTAIVKRDEDKPQRQNQPNFKPKLEWRIEVRESAIGSPPLVGESFTTENGYGCRIKEEPQFDGMHWVCVCAVHKIA